MTTASRTVELQSKAEVLDSYDVIVAGGGFPGVCAAVAAARAGAQVAIVERDGTLGGQAAEIYTFGFAGFFDREGHNFAAGIPWEIVLKTVAEGQSDPMWDTVDYERASREGMWEELARLVPGTPAGLAEEVAANRWVNPLTNGSYLEPNAFRYVLFRLAEEEGIDLYLETPLCDTLIDNGVVKGVVAMGNYGRFALEAPVVVDTTPQAVVAALAGKVFPFPMVYMGSHPRVAGVQIEKLIDYIVEHPEDVEAAQIDPCGSAFGKCTCTNREYDRKLVERMIQDRVAMPMRGFSRLRAEAIKDDPLYETTGFDATSKHKYDRLKELNFPMAGVSDTGDTATPYFQFQYEQEGCGMYWVHCVPAKWQNLDDIGSVSKAVAHYRKQQWLTHKFFRDYVPGFEKARLMDAHPHIARALMTPKDSEGFTDHYIPWEHMKDGGDYYPDSVARVMGHPNVGQCPRGFQVPLRTLICKDVEGLLVTGKPACHFFHMHGTHATLGQAAGVAAALSARGSTDLRRLDVQAVRAELLRQGAVVS